MQGGGYDTIVIATNALLTSMKIKLNKAKICVSKNKFNNTWEQKFNYNCISANRVIQNKKKRFRSVAGVGIFCVPFKGLYK